MFGAGRTELRPGSLQTANLALPNSDLNSNALRLAHSMFSTKHVQRSALVVFHQNVKETFDFPAGFVTI
jgi:hypothetical protein